MTKETASSLATVRPDTSAQPRLIVVDDEADYLGELVAFFRHRGFATRGVCDGASLDAALSEESADLVVLDLYLPGEDGVSIARRLRQTLNIGIVMLTCRDESDSQAKGLRAGADAYLSKETDLFVIEETVRAVLRRIVPSLVPSGAGEIVGVDARQTANGVIEPAWHLDRQTWLLTAPDGRCTNLTARELTLLHQLLAKPGVPCSRADLLACQGKSDTEAARRSLDSTISRLKRKIESALEQPCPIQSAYGVGYVFLAPVLA
ncbi:MAG: response regulator [Magnetovibrio sp.]|nr:response regulator [Magnetovibrio sp.]